MMRGPESEEAYGDGIQPEDITRITGGLEGDPQESRRTYESWEVEEFKNKGDEPIVENDEDGEQFRLLS